MRFNLGLFLGLILSFSLFSCSENKGLDKVKEGFSEINEEAKEKGENTKKKIRVNLGR
jgi:hypothetical protein